MTSEIPDNSASRWSAAFPGAHTEGEETASGTRPCRVTAGLEQAEKFWLDRAMVLRSIPTDFSADTVAQIDARLTAICSDDGVAIPLAIESGSRAWGFPSPDSDYDCRFVFVRPIGHHLTPWPKRDVIETPLVGELDVNGWDLAKALKLLLKGNAVIIEWLMSPIVYRGEGWFRTEMRAFADRFTDREMIARHYLHLGEKQRRLHFANTDSVPGKKMFYALRPAAALRWLRLHPEAAVAPMHFPTLMETCDPPAEVADLIGELIARKAVTRELGAGPLPGPIGAFIDREFAAAQEVFAAGRVRASEEARAEAEALYRRMVERCGGQG